MLQLDGDAVPIHKRTHELSHSPDRMVSSVPLSTTHIFQSQP